MRADVVAQADVDAVWPVFAQQVVECLRKTPNPDYSAGDYWTMCRSGMAFMVVAHDGTDFVGMTIWRFEGGKFCCLLLVGESIRDWLGPLVVKAGEIGRRGGAESLIANGRKEFGALFKRALPGAKIIRQTYEVAI